MKTQKFTEEAEKCLKLLDNVAKIKANDFFETRQLAYIEAKLQYSHPFLKLQFILKPVFIIFLIGINAGIAFSYIHRVNTYANNRNSALIELSDNYMRSSNYYSFTQNK